MSQPQGLFGLPNVGDLIGKLPGASEINALKTDFDDFAATVDRLVGYVNEYSWIPGASSVAGTLTGLDKSLQLVKKLIDVVP
jgi:hypothetical protein